ncbi:hypothetical protein J2S77_000299 [Alkalibacillus salilacus]|uniref:Uncharacterized protein n=1 Tax=Alkalibacillus salilacus TaxID=284582 RepID=A0ABT9VBK8_9BACI|nr:hypothetical protein [Alkalibacillus salilacus]
MKQRIKYTKKLAEKPKITYMERGLLLVDLTFKRSHSMFDEL